MGDKAGGKVLALQYSDIVKRDGLLKGQPLRFSDTLSADQRIVRPEWIVEAVQKAVPVDLDGAIIAGPLDLESKDVSRPFVIRNSRCPGINIQYATFAQLARFDGTTFDGDANLHASHFERDVFFDGTHFCGWVNLSDSTVEVGFHANNTLFQGSLDAKGLRVGYSVDLGMAVFEDNADFTGAQIGGAAIFTKASFGEDATLKYMCIKGNLDCAGTTFAGKMEAVGTQVGSKAIFTEAKFMRDATFDGINVTEDLYFESASEPTTFEAKASFVGAQVGGQGIFTEAKFKEDATFDGMNVTEDLFFESATFEGKASFMGVQVGKEGTFEKATFTQKWDLRQSRFAFFTVDEVDESDRAPACDYRKRLSGGIDLRWCTYEYIDVLYWQKFLDRQEPFDRQPYTQFERVQRRAGQDYLADNVYYRRRQLEGDQRLKAMLSNRLFVGFLLSLIGDRFLRGVAGYGVRHLRMLVWVLLFPFLALLVFHFTPGAANPAPTKETPADCQPQLGWQDAAWLAVGTYLPFKISSAGGCVPSGQLVAVPVAGTRLPLRVSSVASLLEIAGWIFLPTALATFTGFLRHVGSGQD